MNLASYCLILSQSSQAKCENFDLKNFVTAKHTKIWHFYSLQNLQNDNCIRWKSTRNRTAPEQSTK